MTDEIPNIIWPEQSGNYKVVQFMLGEEPYMRFGDKEVVHAKIVTDLMDFSKVLIYAFADEESKKRENKVVGAGFGIIDIEQKTAKLFGISTGLEAEINKGHLDLIKPFSPEWEIISS